MKYDFTSIIDRHGKDAMAVDALYPGVPFGPPHDGVTSENVWWPPLQSCTSH